MALDRDLLEFRRAVAVAPEDAAARLALGATLARSGESREAALELWRARQLGAASGATGPILRLIGARPSPWTHFMGDSELSRRSPVSGPRRPDAQVVAASGELFDSGDNLEAWNVVLAEDGTIVLRTNYALVALDGRSLEQRAAAAIPQAYLAQLAVAPANRVLAVSRPRGTIGVLETDFKTIHTLSLESRAYDVAVDSQGSVILTAVSPGEVNRYRFAQLSPDLERLENRFASPVAGMGKLALHDGICGLTTPRRATVKDFSGNEVSGVNLDGVVVAHAFAPDGSFVLAEKSPGARRGDALLISAIEPPGRILWQAQIVSLASWCELAVGRTGTVFLRTREELVKVERDTVAWRHVTNGPLEPLIVVDSDDVCYYTFVVGEDTPVLQALGPDQASLFELRGIDRPFAIDCWGRLLARRGREVVAIA